MVNGDNIMSLDRQTSLQTLLAGYAWHNDTVPVT